MYLIIRRIINFLDSKSITKEQKYKAILPNKETDNEVTVKFGHKKYEQYKDCTELGAYSHLDHNDETRREYYCKRHAKEKNENFSSGW